jgi:hypothetical protein
VLTIICSSCTETFPLLTNTYEEMIVVEATLTNELKNQEIKLTKTSKFEDVVTETETGAKVFITDDAGNQYDFEEESESYLSTSQFQAVPDRKYQLHITTQDGKSFESSAETLTTVNPMQSITPVVEKNEDINGIAIRVHSFDPGKQSKYYRYTYSETYKVVAPKWTTVKAVYNAEGVLTYIPNSSDTKICYGNKTNTGLLLTDTNNLTEDRINYLVRFIDEQDYITTTRYSILITQYVESLEAYTYYTTLKKMSGPGSILTPNQPGFILGNIKSIKNPSDKVVGYFDVASASSERIYFNHHDLFPTRPSPPYITDCTQFCYGGENSYPDPCTRFAPFSIDLALKKITYLFTSGFDYWVNAPCGDCTTIASNIRPTFWTD